RRRLREPIALEDHEPRGVEELVDLVGERGAARHEVAQPSAGARLELREHQSLRDAVLDAKQPAGLATGELLVGPSVGNVARPEEDALLHSPARERILEHT